jgi:ribonuclease HII
MYYRKFLKAEQVALSWDVPDDPLALLRADRRARLDGVVAAAVILDDLLPIKGLADSSSLPCSESSTTRFAPRRCAAQ